MQQDLFLQPRHIIPISGKDSLATALFQTAQQPELNYEFMFNPTGAELPEIFEWLARVEKHLGKPIIQVGKDLAYIINVERSGFLPSQFHRYCTNQSKIEPMEKFIGSSPCYVYYGIRADEDRVGYLNSTYPNIRAMFPIKEAGIDLKAVYAIVKNAGLKPPMFFWKSVYDEVNQRLGGANLQEILSEYEIDILFAWRTRANCYWCFNQRKYEWVGLLEHYPELFWKAEAMEHNGSEYYWNGKDYPLTKIVGRKNEIRENRIRQILKYIETKRMNEGEDDKGFIDILSVTSCGLLCGK